MTDTPTNLIRLSQGHLNLLETCPPKFQQVYIDRLSSLLHPEQQENLAWGSRFHLLMQQKELGLSVEPLLQADEKLHHSLTALLEAAPEILQDRDKWREAEHCRTISFGNYLLTVIYDLLVAEDRQAKIIDWKTYLQPQNKNKLARNWQTRLYLYVLAETTDYSPKQISMTYWFVKLPSRPQSLTFSYSKNQHEQTKQDLNYLLTFLDDRLKEYAEKGIVFPHRVDCETNCPYFSSLVASSSVEKQKWNDAIASIEEVSL